MDSVVESEKVLVVEDPLVTALDASQDPVMVALGEVKELYRAARDDWEQRCAELDQARAAAARSEQSCTELADEVQGLRKQLAQEHKRTERQRERARHLAEGLRNIHRALFDGNVFSLILRACTTITGATRGLYITLRGQEDLSIRAAIDVDGYPQAPPSPFLRSLCQKVLQERESFLCNDDDYLSALPEAPGPQEHFRNLIAAPVVLLHGLVGVIVVADKLHGDFDREDAETIISVGDQASVAVANQRLQHELQDAYLSIVSVLADAVEAKDPYTHGHCRLVARYARLIAQRLNLSDLERGVSFYGGLLHDIGKIGISDGILNKPGKLLPEEWELMRSHVRVGRDLLAHAPVLAKVTDVVLLHHEAYNGSGYPRGLKGDEIPLPARIVCVADAYCAMISKRSYKESFNAERARAELVRCRGTQFDPAVVDAFLEVLDRPELQTEDHDEFRMPPGLYDTEEFQHLLAADDGGGRPFGVEPHRDGR